MSCVHCLALAEQLAELKRELDQQRATRLDRAHLLAKRFGLPRQEGIILAALYHARGRVLSSDQLDEALPEAEDGLVRTRQNIHVRICNIRRKTGFAAIDTHHGVGWSITDLGRLVCDEALEARARAA